MKYNKYQPLNEDNILSRVTNKVDKYKNSKMEAQIDNIRKSGDVTEKYRKYRELLRNPYLTPVQQYTILDDIYNLFKGAFTQGWKSGVNSCRDLFDDVTASISPAGDKPGNAKFGIRQLLFWVHLIEAYRWEEILDTDNVFKKVIHYIVANKLNESKLNEAPVYISQKDLENNPQLKQKLSQNSGNNSSNNQQSKIKLNNFNNFQKLYNMYARGELDNFENDPSILNALSTDKNNKTKEDYFNAEDFVNNLNSNSLNNSDIQNVYTALTKFMQNKGIQIPG